MTELSAGTVEEFRTSFRGTALTPGEDGYDTARAVWNGSRPMATVANSTGRVRRPSG